MSLPADEYRKYIYQNIKENFCRAYKDYWRDISTEEKDQEKGAVIVFIEASRG
jgi:hypothetical protein